MRKINIHNPFNLTGLLTLVLALVFVLSSGCEDPLRAPDPAGDPITEIQFSYNKWTKEIYLAAKVAPRLNGVILDTVYAVIFDFADSTIMADTITIADDGQTGDILSDDGVFATVIPADSTTLSTVLDSIATTVIGMIVEAVYGTQVTNASDSFDLSNYRPEILAVSMPTAMYIPCAGDPLGYDLDTLVVTVRDSNGLDDIQTCYLNFEKPDSNLSSGSPIALYDDGYEEEGFLRWDEVANDGKYSRLILIDGNSQEGEYRSHYFARDFNGLVSNDFMLKLSVFDTCGSRGK
ncbi:MAG: hypothetical protein H8E14_17470 [Candidatus Marinimicrobia bacterium]|nr:hypothetical protein [Candidatus Neomarinimicrobiota bacterium]